MINYLIYINKLSEPVLVEVPEKPTRTTCGGKPDCCAGAMCQHLSYEARVQAALSDESKHIRFKDEQSLILLLWGCSKITNYQKDNWKVSLKGQTFPLPNGVSVRFEKTCVNKGNRDSCANETCWDLNECQNSPELLLAILVQEPKVEEQEAKNTMQEFYQTGFVPCDIPGEYFQSIHVQLGKPDECNVTVQEFKHSDNRLSLMWFKNRVKAFCIEARTDLNDKVFIKGTVERPSEPEEQLKEKQEPSPVSLDTHTAEEEKSATQVLYENGIYLHELNDEFNNSMLQSMTEYASLRENNLQTKLNESLALIYKCENTLEKIGHIFNTLKDNSNHSALVQLVEAIDIDIPLIQAKIKDELERLKKPSL